ncbi:MAG: ABC transporter permease [Caldilineales bacterium]|nr:ABC transporter permease [Caldilineales bacterium]
MKLGPYRLQLQKRLALSSAKAGAISLLAIVAALALFSLLFILADVNPLTAYQKIFSYAFFNRFGLPLTISRFAFLLLASLAFILPFRAGLWNIGMTGQLYLGALAAFAVIFLFKGDPATGVRLPPALLILLMLLAAALGGALYAAIAGFLRGSYGVNEIVVTMILNFIAFWLVSYMIKDGGMFMNPGGRGESFELPAAVRAPMILGAPFTIYLALLLALLITFLFARTRIGYEIKAYGQSPAAARYAGVNTAFLPLLVFLLGGAVAGLAGYHYFAAVPGVYKIARNYGFFGDLAFYGIICGLISRGHPLAAIPVAFLFGGLSIGGRFVQGELNMSFGLDYALLGVLMITLVAFQFFFRYQIAWIKTDKEPRHVGIRN